jgi:hypothetical protein
MGSMAERRELPQRDMGEARPPTVFTTSNTCTKNEGCRVAYFCQYETQPKCRLSVGLLYVIKTILKDVLHDETEA